MSSPFDSFNIKPNDRQAALRRIQEQEELAKKQEEEKKNAAIANKQAKEKAAVDEITVWAAGTEEKSPSYVYHRDYDVAFLDEMKSRMTGLGFKAHDRSEKWVGRILFFTRT